MPDLISLFYNKINSETFFINKMPFKVLTKLDRKTSILRV